MKKNFMQYLLISIFILLLINSCGRHKFKPTASADERMEYAEKLFNDGDYLDARTEFRIVILNFPGSTISDRAQLRLADCFFNLKEYIIAAEEYKKLIRVFPNSEYVDDAQYKIALSLYKLSPKYSLDQDYTNKAIEEFQKFLDDYPTSDLAPEVNKNMKLCREKLGKKYYRNAESYRKLTWYKSAIVYYDFVLDNYYDTEFAMLSLYGKAECLQNLNDSEQAIKFYQLYLEKYPNGSKTRKARIQLAKLLDKNN
jgi:outer membrane protein assembly factor BamD